MWVGVVVSAWCLVCVSVCQQMVWMPAGHPTQCLPQYPPSPPPKYTAATHVRCAAISQLKLAQGFSFADNICSPMGAGQGPSVKDITYVTTPRSLTEVAHGSSTFASPEITSLLYSTEPSRAVDEDLVSEYHSKGGLQYPWWVVDLGSIRTIHLIKILSRQNSYDFRFHDIEVRVGSKRVDSGNFASYSLFSLYPGPYRASYRFLSCHRAEGVKGRYVSIQRTTPEDHMLILLDVQVYVAP